MGYKVEPRYNANRADIVQSIIFENKEDLIKYCQGIQKYLSFSSKKTPTSKVGDELCLLPFIVEVLILDSNHGIINSVE